MSRKVHYSSDELWSKEKWVVCGQTVMKEGGYTTNPAEVTCKECKVIIKTVQMNTCGVTRIVPSGKAMKA